MYIHIPIPIGIKHTASLQRDVWKYVSCEHCEQTYAYLLPLEATGEDHDLFFLGGEASAQRAQDAAAQNLMKKSENCVLPVPCPHCGFYQEAMVRQLIDNVSINRFQIAGAVIALLSFSVLAFDIAYAWVVTLLGAVTGVSLLAYGYVRAFGFDPNAGDLSERLAIGRKYAVWGEQLAELIREMPSPRPSD